MKFSIITVNLNNAVGLKKTIQSVITQTNNDFEYIIIDGGSTDESIEIIEEFTDKITFWISENDRGLFYAMNKGITKAQGEWIGIINSGDWFERNTLEIVDSFSGSFSYAKIIHGAIKIWKDNQLVKIKGVHSEFLTSGMIEHPACFVKREVYENLGFFDTSYKIASDYDFMARAFKNGINFKFIDRILANYELGGLSTTSPSAIFEVHRIKQQYGFENIRQSTKKEHFYNLLYHLRELIIPWKLR